MTTKTASSIAPTPGQQLAGALDALIAAHERLLALAGEHRALLARVDGKGIEALTQRQAELVRQIATLEQQRRAAARAVLGAGPKRGGDPEPTIQQVRAALPEPERSAIGVLADRLRGLIERIRHEHRVLRRATGLMLAHMEGLMRQVGQALSHAGTYSRTGSVGAGRATVVSALDLTT